MSKDSSSASQHDDKTDTAKFEQLFGEMTNDFGAACEKNNVQTAIAVAIHPGSKHPIVFTRGHKYDIAIILAKILKTIKGEMAEELNTDYMMDYSNGDQ